MHIYLMMVATSHKAVFVFLLNEIKKSFSFLILYELLPSNTGHYTHTHILTTKHFEFIRVFF